MHACRNHRRIVAAERAVPVPPVPGTNAASTSAPVPAVDAARVVCSASSSDAHEVPVERVGSDRVPAAADAVPAVWNASVAHTVDVAAVVVIGDGLAVGAVSRNHDDVANESVAWRGIGNESDTDSNSMNDRMNRVDMRITIVRMPAARGAAEVEPAPVVVAAVTGGGWSSLRRLSLRSLSTINSKC